MTSEANDNQARAPLLGRFGDDRRNASVPNVGPDRLVANDRAQLIAHAAMEVVVTHLEQIHGGDERYILVDP